jgi:phage tail sheath protein FI
MPSTVSYPGVYVEETGSGGRTIAGVATSIAAFVGRAARGPTDEPVTIHNYGDFERIFGGLWAESSLGYAVRDFYLNGGIQAVIVRLYHPTLAAPICKARLRVNGLDLEAQHEGEWGNALRARIHYNVAGPDAASLFNLWVRDGLTHVVEVFRDVSVQVGHVRQVDKVLASESHLVAARGLPATKPTPHPDPDRALGEDDIWADNAVATNSVVAVSDQADNGGGLLVDDFTGHGKEDAKQGLYALKKAHLFNLLCIPPYLATGDVDPTLVGAAAQFCEDRRAMLLVDPISTWKDSKAAKSGVGAIGTSSKNAGLFFPRLRQANAQHAGQVEDFAPCGAVAGVFARTDTNRGVWKAPAGLDTALVGVPQLSVCLTDAENGMLSPLGINCLRTFPTSGRVVWGARTLQGDDRLASEWKYIPVRRTALFIEESLYRGTQWAVFEPNDEPLWSQLRQHIGAFMLNLFQQGAFQGPSPKDAYFVQCNKDTTTQNDIDLGVVNVLVGFAPLKPAEFVLLKVQQCAGQLAV